MKLVIYSFCFNNTLQRNTCFLGLFLASRNSSGVTHRSEALKPLQLHSSPAGLSLLFPRCSSFPPMAV